MDRSKLGRWAGLAGLALVTSCQRPPASVPAASVQPSKTRYHCEHHGDHPTWHATLYVAVDADTAAGKPVWRRHYRFEEINIKRGGKFEGTTLVDRATLATLETEDFHVRSRGHFVFEPQRIVGTQDDGEGHVTPVTIPISGFVETGPWNGLDLWVLSQPLQANYRTRVALIDDFTPGKAPRDFVVSVERIEPVRVPAGEFTAYRVLFDPQDGDQSLRTVYHVRSDGPPLIVRREFIVNPETTATRKRSIGVEELEAVER